MNTFPTPQISVFRRSLALVGLITGVVVLTALLALPRPAVAVVSDPVEALSEKVLGAEDAPITIIEFASLTCPHCAAFHANVLPQLKSDYIETGKAKLIYRDFPLDRYALTASKLARCAGNDRYFAFLNILFQKQPVWALRDNPIPALKRIAKFGGIDAADFKQCLNNKVLEEGILDMRLQAERKYEISETPTIYINGERYEGKHSFEALNAALQELGLETESPATAPMAAADESSSETEPQSWFDRIINAIRNL